MNFIDFFTENSNKKHKKQHNNNHKKNIVNPSNVESYTNYDGSSNDMSFNNQSGGLDTSGNSLNNESLMQQYNNLLTQYQQTYQSYLNSLSSSDTSGNDVSGNDVSGNTTGKKDASGNDASGNTTGKKDASGNDASGNDASGNNTNTKKNTKKFTSVNNSAYWGSGSISEGAASSITDCQNMCTASSSCTGATFSASSQYCWVRSGQGDVVSSSADTAIVPQSIQLMAELKDLNQQMLNINNQIIQQANQSAQNPSTNPNSSENQQKLQQLRNNYNYLMNDRGNIERSIKENIQLSGELIDSTLWTNHYYAVLSFLIFAVLICIFIVIKMSSSSSSSSSSNSMMGGGSKGFKLFIASNAVLSIGFLILLLIILGQVLRLWFQGENILNLLWLPSCNTGNFTWWFITIFFFSLLSVLIYMFISSRLNTDGSKMIFAGITEKTSASFIFISMMALLVLIQFTKYWFNGIGNAGILLWGILALLAVFYYLFIGRYVAF